MSTPSSIGLIEKDPERLLKFKECCDLLLIGGYFRARIQSLSAFDRVVGGIAWSLAASGAETGEIDVIFTENASIGQRIRMSDQLVAALLAAKCPHRLQSHQIQGLDYSHLFPVIQWLVRSVLEVRRLTGDITRLQSMRQFKSHHRDCMLPSGETFIANVNVHYRPHRLFKQKAGASFGTIQRRADATLLEFGATINRTQFDAESQSQSNQSNSKVSQARDKVGAAMGVAPTQSNNQAATDAAMYNELAAQLADLGAASGRVSGASVGAIVGMQSDEIKRAIDEYNENKRRSEEAQETLAKQGKRGAEAAYLRQIENMQKRIAAVQEQITLKEPNHVAAQSRLAELEAGVQEQEAYAARCRRESAKLEALEAEASNSQLLQKLQSLVALNEQLTRQEETFKQSCIASRSSILAELESIENAASNTQSTDVARMLQIEKVFESETSKLNKLRVLLARRNQVLSKLVRAIDDRPSRAELLQYEKRFAELSSLVHEKLGETRKYYAMYNTLSDSLSMMQAEKQLFDELITQFPQAAKSKAGKMQLVERLTSILGGIKQQSEAKGTAFSNARTEADALAAKHAACNEKQRDYAKLLREFKEEVDRNDQLLASASVQ